MQRGIQGQFEVISTVGERAEAFVPSDLPPEVGIDWSTELRMLFDRCLVALGRLDTLSGLLPDASLFLYMHIRKEALLSSMIEGTQSSLSDLLLFEIEQTEGYSMPDASEVSNYVRAMERGLERLKEGSPVNLRLMKELHEILLDSGRGAAMRPGEFRNSQNWIGGSRPSNAIFVPPPPGALPELLGNLEKFINDVPEPTQVLAKAAMMHVQFETIHPFLDGNGRLGRLMITLMLCADGILKEPLLYVSLYFKTQRERYYALLTHVRETGDWEAWLEFFGEALLTSAEQASDTAYELLALAEDDRLKIQTLGRPAGSALRIHRALLKTPVANAERLGEAAGLSPATVNKSLVHLESLGIVQEITARQRNRVFSYGRYLEIISMGTEPYN